MREDCLGPTKVSVPSGVDNKKMFSAGSELGPKETGGEEAPKADESVAPVIIFKALVRD